MKKDRSESIERGQIVDRRGFGVKGE